MLIMFIFLLDIIMIPSELKSIAINLKKQDKSYSEIRAILEMSRYAARNLVTFKCKVNKMKLGYKHKISKASALCIKKEISKLTQQGES